MNRKLWALILSLGLVSFAMAGCSASKQETRTAPAPAQETKQPAAKKTKYPITLKDSAGRDVTIPAEPKRIVSAAPSNTELVFALGKGSSLVGRTDFCDYPAEATKIESIGGFSRPNYEKIVNLKPDLLLMIGGTVEVRTKLTDEFKINVFVVDPKNFDQLFDGIEELGQILDAQESADKVIGEMQQATKEISDKATTATTKPKVFYEVWHDPLLTAGTGTFIDDLIKLAGGTNAGGDVAGWATYSLEKLQANNPDIMVTGREQAPQVKARKGWEGLKAVKENKVLFVPDANTVQRPGPRLIEGLKWFAQTLHPELFH
jgi:iron complex transport system substrate-binding protein